MSFLIPVAPSTFAASCDLLRDRRVTGEEDDDGERQHAPRLHGDDRRHAEVLLAEPLRRVQRRALADVERPLVEQSARGPDQPRVHERPVHDAVEAVVDPQPRDRSERDRGRPREQDQEAEEPAAPERPREVVREDRRADDDDRLREERHHGGVAQRVPEDRVVPRRAEVVEPDPAAAERAGRGVGEAEIDREDERRPDEQDDEDHRRCDERGREDAPTLEDIGAAPHQATLGYGYHCHTSASLWWRGILVRLRRRRAWPRSPSRG